MDDDGTQPVFQRRLSRRDIDILLREQTLHMAAGNRDRGKALAGPFLPRRRLAIRGRSNSDTHQTRRAHIRPAERTVQFHLRRPAHPLVGLRKGRALSRKMHLRSLWHTKVAIALPARSALRAHGRQRESLRCLQESRLLVVYLLPGQIQRPHQAERSLLRRQHRA